MTGVLYPPVIKFGQDSISADVKKYVRKIIENVWDEYVKNAPCDSVAAIVAVGAYVWLEKQAYDDIVSAKAGGWEASDWKLNKASSKAMTVYLPNGREVSIDFTQLKYTRDMTKKEYEIFMAFRNIICKNNF